MKKDSNELQTNYGTRINFISFFEDDMIIAEWKCMHLYIQINDLNPESIDKIKKYK